MKRPDDKIISAAVNFAARWGFLTRDLFFEFMCPMKRVQSYNYWSHLVESGLFVKSKANDRTLILSQKSRRALGDSARPARSHFYIEHDKIVARIFLALEIRDLILDSWLEDELMRNRIQTYSLLGVQSINRIPDLVFDLKNQNGKPVRCALEIERTTKSQARYAKMSLAYLNSSRIDVVLVGCSQHSTETSVRRAFSTSAHLAANRTPGIFQHKEFDSNSLNMQIRFQNNEMSFERFLEIATKAPAPKAEQRVNKLRTAVRSFKTEKPEAA